MSGSDLHSTWARLFVASLASAGVVDFVVSPGSRSTPLALAAVAEPRVRVQVVLDERVAAFFALGQARVTGVPSVLLCTSGTAGAHYLPAVIEAAQSHVPMLILTADRPWEDYDAAAAQTIDQVKLFGDFVRHYAELGLPDKAPSALRAVPRIASQAVRKTLTPAPGPVHVNARFRKPLEPIPGAAEDELSRLAGSLAERGAPRALGAALAWSPAAVLQLVKTCSAHERGVIVCGPAWSGGEGALLRRAVLALSEKTGFPIWAEATSGVRFGGGTEVIGSFDVLLRAPAFRKRPPPELFIELGGPVVSATYASYVAEHVDATRIVIAPHGWNDPHGTASFLLFGDPAAVVAQAAEQIPGRAARSSWQKWQTAAEAVVWDAVRGELADDVLSEGHVARALLDALPPEATLMVGNSLPVRDLDLFCPPQQRPLRVLHQRGASGIDGLIAGAAGARSKLDGALALLLGDLSAQHDLGGLCMLRAVSGPLIVVIVQNHGGRIFEQLPVGSNAAVAPHFLRLFLTPQPVDFAPACAAFGIPFARVDSQPALRQALCRALESDRPLVIEAVVPECDGLSRRKRIFARAAVELERAGASRGVESDIPAPPARAYLHGFLGAPSLWAAVAAELGGAATLDYLPGHGPSPWHLPGADFYGVVDALAGCLPAPACALYGYSLGARLALAIALRHPQRVSELVLLGVDPGIRSDAERKSRVAWEDELVRKLETAGLEEFVRAWESLPLFDSQKHLPAAVLAAQRAARMQHDPALLAWSLRTLGTGRMPNLWPLLPSLRVPTQLITGALDRKFTAIAKEMTSSSALIRHQVIENAGHNLILEAKEPLLSLLSSPFPSHHGERIHERDTVAPCRAPEV